MRNRLSQNRKEFRIDGLTVSPPAFNNLIWICNEATIKVDTRKRYCSLPQPDRLETAHQKRDMHPAKAVFSFRRRQQRPGLTGLLAISCSDFSLANCLACLRSPILSWR